jgi:integration host factor subunit beta
MKKSNLVKRLAGNNPHLYERHIERIVDSVLDVITRALTRRDRVELRGFGVFTARERKARMGRNPRSGARVSIPQKFVPFFKTGREMQARLNRPEREN